MYSYAVSLLFLVLLFFVTGLVPVAVCVLLCCRPTISGLVIFCYRSCASCCMCRPGPGRYSDRSLFRQVDIPTGRYSDRSIFRQTGRYSDKQVVIPTGRYSDKQFVIPTGRYSDRSIVRQTGLYSDSSIVRQKVDIPKGLYSDRSLFRHKNNSDERINHYQQLLW